MSSQESELLVEIRNGTGLVTLNRPKALNALSRDQVKALTETLHQWKGKVRCVVLRGSGGKAFCSGGDVKVTPVMRKDSVEVLKDSARGGYVLVAMIARYATPCVALLDGITMGTGVGISVHCRYRIITEKTVLAMPETAIGLYPDVSGSYFLSRLPGRLGLFLGLTGHRLKAKDVVKSGLGTHYVLSSNIPHLLQALLDLRDGDVDSVVRRFSEDISDHKFSLEAQMGVINEAFSAPTVEGILQRLQDEGSEFSLSTVKHLRKMSPTSLKLAKKGIEKGANMSVEDCLHMEYGLISGVFEAVCSGDFYEGVRAFLADKDRSPKWDPPTIEEVTDDMVEEMFKYKPPHFLSKL